MDVLITCPPMLGMLAELGPQLAARGLSVTAPEVAQTVPEAELLRLVPRFEGWIIGDDPANRRVLAAGCRGRLRAAVKWGVGVDNVDFDAARELGLPVANTPGMFGDEVADVAMCYLAGLARETFWIDRQVRAGGWPKPCGVSLAGKRVALVGFGDIGRCVARRLLAAGMLVSAYDPRFEPHPGLEEVRGASWPEGVEAADFIVLCCALTPENRHMIDAALLERVKPGVRLVNVARGPLVDEPALARALESGRVHSVALDVFEAEPLPADSELRGFERAVFGSHNGSNTAEAVLRTSHKAIDLLCGFLENGT